MEYRTLWSGVSVVLILRFYPERVETKRCNGVEGMFGPLQSRLERNEGNRVVAYRIFRLPLGRPVQQPTKFELALNLKSAKALEIVFPPGLPAAAAEVIERIYCSACTLFVAAHECPNGGVERYFTIVERISSWRLAPP
jgi:hypothetical protein